MTNINSIGSSGSFIPVTIGQDGTPVPVSASLAKDTIAGSLDKLGVEDLSKVALSPSGADFLPAPQISDVEWFQTVNSAKRKLQEALKTTEIAERKAAGKIFKDIFSEADFLLSNQALAQPFITQVARVNLNMNQTINAQNAVLQDINSRKTLDINAGSALIDATNNYNAAIDTLNQLNAANTSATAVLNSERTNLNNAQSVYEQNPTQENYSAYQTAIQTYNQAALAQDTAYLTLRQGIQNYNASVSTYETAISQYNAFVAIRNQDVSLFNTSSAAYNAQALTNNALASALNSSFSQFSIPNIYTLAPQPTIGITLANIPTLTAPNPIPIDIPIQSVITYANVPSTIGLPIISNLYPVPNYSNTIFSQLMLSILDPSISYLTLAYENALSSDVQIDNEFTDPALLNNIYSVVPAAFILQFSSANISGATDASGQANATTILGLGNPYLERVLNKTLLTEILSNNGVTNTGNLTDRLQLLSLGILGNAIRQSMGPSLAALEPMMASLAKGSSLFNIVAAAAFNNRIQDYVSSGAIEMAIRSNMASNPQMWSVPSYVQEQLVSELAAGINTNLLMASANILTRSLGLSGIFPQLMVNIPGLPPEFAASLLNIINDPAIYNFQSFVNSMRNQFQQQGIGSNEATFLALSANLALQQGLIGPSAASISKGSIRMDLLESSLISGLLSKGYDMNTAYYIAKGALNAALPENASLTAAQFRSNLDNQLRLFGAASIASEVSNRAILAPYTSASFGLEGLGQAYALAELNRFVQSNLAFASPLTISQSLEMMQSMRNAMAERGLSQTESSFYAISANLLQQQGILNPTEPTLISASTIRSDLLGASIINSLMNQGYSLTKAKEVAEKATANLFSSGQSFTDKLGFSESLRNQLTYQGVSHSDANMAVTQALLSSSATKGLIKPLGSEFGLGETYQFLKNNYSYFLDFASDQYRQLPAGTAPTPAFFKELTDGFKQRGLSESESAFLGKMSNVLYQEGLIGPPSAKITTGAIRTELLEASLTSAMIRNGRDPQSASFIAKNAVLTSIGYGNSSEILTPAQFKDKLAQNLRNYGIEAKDSNNLAAGALIMPMAAKAASNAVFNRNLAAAALFQHVQENPFLLSDLKELTLKIKAKTESVEAEASLAKTGKKSGSPFISAFGGQEAGQVNPVTGKPVSTLRTLLQKHTIELLSAQVGQQQANAIAQVIVDSLLGPATAAQEVKIDSKNPMSMLRLLSDKMKEANIMESDKRKAQFVESFKEMIKSTTEGYLLEKKIMDPAYSFLEAVSAMYAHTKTQFSAGQSRFSPLDGPV